MFPVVDSLLIIRGWTSTMTNKDYSHLLEIKLDVKDINHILNSIKFLQDKDIPEEDRLVYKEKFIGWLSQFKLSLDDLAIEDLI